MPNNPLRKRAIDRTVDFSKEKDYRKFVDALLLQIDDLIKSINEPYPVQAAAPTVGTWKIGDIVYNSAPASGQYIGWVCTAAGTPGTWKAFGLIA